MEKPRIGIIGGHGKMGAYFKRFFKQHEFHVHISDSSENTFKSQNTSFSNKDIASRCDVIIISTPFHSIPDVISEIAPFLTEKQLLMDITSIKTNPINEMLKTSAAVIGLHPLFGPSTDIKGQTIIICPSRPKTWLNFIETIFVRLAQAKIVYHSAKEHDSLMAIIQSLRHFHSLALGSALNSLTIDMNSLNLTMTPPFRIQIDLLARLLNEGNLHITEHLLFDNPYIKQILSTFNESINDLFHIVESKDSKKLYSLFTSLSNTFEPLREKALQESNDLVRVVYSNARNESPKDTTPPPKNAIAILGPPHSYTHRAAQYLFTQDNIPRYFCQSITEVFDMVESGHIANGVIPIENKIHGTVRQTIIELSKRNVSIERAFVLPISHCLASIHKITKNDFKNVKFILSHEQALAQCSIYLQNNFPHAKLITTTSTSEAMNQIHRDHADCFAAIGSISAARALDLNIIGHDISNDPNNQTKFIQITKSHLNKTLDDDLKIRTMCAFTCERTQPGTLAKILNIFAQKKINLTMVESCPIGNHLQEYIFFIECEGSLSDMDLNNLLSKDVHSFTRFGTFPILTP